MRAAQFDLTSHSSWKGSTRLDTQRRLDEIVRVRHSVAHGFALPALSWTTAPSGQIRLTSESIDSSVRFLNKLVDTIEVGLKAHLEAATGITLKW